MTDPDPILSKVRKLLAKAEDPAATVAEAAAFTAKATELITTYGINAALLAQTSPDHGAIADRVVEFAAPYARDKAHLGFHIARNLRCTTVQRQLGSAISLHIFGPEPDLVSVEVLLTSLLLQGTRDLTRTPVPPQEHPAAFRRSWWNGFAIAVSQRLAVAHRKAQQEAERASVPADPSVALVLANRAQEAVAARDVVYPNLATMRPRQLSGGGTGAGYASGQRAHLGAGPSLATARQRQISG